MNRRRFLNLIAGAGTTAALPPSMVWPFKKIFLPPIIVKPTIEEIISTQFAAAIAAMLEEYPAVVYFEPEDEKDWPVAEAANQILAYTKISIPELRLHV